MHFDFLLQVEESELRVILNLQKSECPILYWELTFLLKWFLSKFNTVLLIFKFFYFVYRCGLKMKQGRLRNTN